MRNLSRRILLLLICVFSTATSRSIAQNALTITPLNSSAGATSIYNLDFILPDSLPPQGAISIVFPDEFDLSKVNIAASSIIKGGFSTFVVNQEVIIVRKGEGNLLKSGKRVDIKLSAVTNPKMNASDYTLKLFIHRDGKKILNNIKEEKYKPESHNRSLEGSFSLANEQ